MTGASPFQKVVIEVFNYICQTSKLQYSMFERFVFAVSFQKRIKK